MELGEIIGAGGGGTAVVALIWRLVTLEIRAKQIPSLIKTVSNIGIQLEHVNTKVEDIWDIFLDEGRSKRRDLRVYDSAPKLSDEGKKMVPDDIKQAIAQYRKECHNDCEIAGHEIICLIKKSLGIARLSADAKERGISLLEYVALLADYYED